MKNDSYFFVMAGLAHAGQVGDMNADGVVGLEEAIIALRIASGVPAHFGCSPGQRFCLDSTIGVECDGSGNEYIFIENCTDIPGYGCNPNSGECYACIPSQKYCINEDFEGTCNSTGTGNSAFRNCLVIYGTGCDPKTGSCIVN